MKRMFFISAVFFVMFLPLNAFADGVNKKPRKKPVNCAKLKGKARQACLNRRAAAAAAAERRRQEAARRAELWAQAQENRLRAESQANIVKDDTSGEDLKVRQIAIGALNGKAGTVLVMEPQTGKVLTIVNQEWGIRKSFVPCSTIKLVTSIAGVQENVIDEEGEITESKFALDLDKAIAKSNNDYFQRVGVKVGNDKFLSTAKTLGLGEKTGINAEGEVPGKLPYVKKTALQYSHGTGTEVTALQLAVLASEITNGGRKVKPFIPKAGQDTSTQPTQIEVPQATLKELIPGMQGATEFGTARRSGGFGLGMVGKTGTCSDSISRVGLFTSVAPVDNLKFTVVVIIRGRRDQTNGPVAAIIAGKIYQALLGNPSGATIPVVAVTQP